VTTSKYHRSYFRCKAPRCHARRQIDVRDDGARFIFTYDGWHNHAPDGLRARIAKRQRTASGGAEQTVFMPPSELDQLEKECAAPIDRPCDVWSKMPEVRAAPWAVPCARSRFTQAPAARPVDEGADSDRSQAEADTSVPSGTEDRLPSASALRTFVDGRWCPALSLTGSRTCARRSTQQTRVVVNTPNGNLLLSPRRSRSSYHIYLISSSAFIIISVVTALVLLAYSYCHLCTSLL
jgi:hypothetical protein